jgi:hypothetical protein
VEMLREIKLSSIMHKSKAQIRAHKKVWNSFKIVIVGGKVKNICWLFWLGVRAGFYGRKTRTEEKVSGWIIELSLL